MLAFYRPNLYKVPMSGALEYINLKNHYMARSISLIENLASSEQYLMSAEVMRSTPPPKQYP